MSASVRVCYSVNYNDRLPDGSDFQPVLCDDIQALELVIDSLCASNALASKIIIRPRYTTLPKGVTEI